jgi:radical SAM superfamily enzyme YgiQ (UPF0313 family)
MNCQAHPTLSIALISPAAEYDLDLRNYSQSNPLVAFQRMPRLGVLTLEALTPPEWEVRIIDERVDVIVPQAVESALIGISAMTSQAPRAFALARQFKALGKIVVMGGYFPSLSPELALADPNIDSIIVGRGESAWPKVLEDFKRGQLQRRYQYPVKEKKFTLPPVNYHLCSRAHGYNGSITQIQSTLGCKFSCKFCAIPQFHGGSVAFRDLDDLVEEIDNAPTRRIAFIDDNLLNSAAYLGALCDRIEPLNKLWSAQISMDIRGSHKLVKRMARAGCYWVHVGIESLDAGTLKEQEKRQNDISKYMDTFKMFREEGISVSTGIILGFPTDARSVFENTHRFLDSASLDAVSFHYYTCYPGYPEHRRFQDAGQLITQNLAHYDTYHPVVRTENFTTEELIESVDALKKDFYRPGRLVSRAAKGLLQGYPGVARAVAAGTVGYLNCRKGLPAYI